MEIKGLVCVDLRVLVLRNKCTLDKINKNV